ncbi:MAG: hypothetical protein ACK56I_28565, partial [bacterium]
MHLRTEGNLGIGCYSSTDRSWTKPRIRPEIVRHDDNALVSSCFTTGSWTDFTYRFTSSGASPTS